MKAFKYIILASTLLVFLSFTVEKKSFAEFGTQGHPDHGDEQKHADHICTTGDRQSPIGISVTEKAKLDSITFHYYPTHLRIINNGYTIQVNYGYGSSISIGHKRYDLLQFHFHTPSEHVIHGKHYAMEAHLVHKGAHGELAVIAVLMVEGKENKFINTLWHNLPKDQGKEHAEIELKINANELLPKDFSYYTYLGSLTTPPYSEIINWFVLKTPIEVSKAELDKFTSIFKIDARPIQPQHGRVVKEYVE